MAIFKCKMCGGDLNIQQGMTVCPYSIIKTKSKALLSRGF